MKSPNPIIYYEKSIVDKSIVLDTVFGTALLFPCLPFQVLIVGKYSVKLATGTLFHILSTT